MRQDSTYALRFGLESVEPQERIEPDQTPAGFVEAFDFRGEAGASIAEGDGGAAFMLTDQDGNFWEILENPPGGYSGRFQGTCATGHA